MARDEAAGAFGADPERLRQRLFPLGKPQERVLPGILWLRRESLLDRMAGALGEAPSPIILEET
jgi:hypothetical protein